MRTLIQSCLFALFLSTLSSPVSAAFNAPIGRRVVALNLNAGRVFIGWRYRESDGQQASYEVKRADNETGPFTMAGIFRQKDGTNFIDSACTTGNTFFYYVTTPSGISRTLKVKPSGFGSPCLEIPNRSGPLFRKIALGDLDGDGLFEIVICRQDGDKAALKSGTEDSDKSGETSSREKNPFYVEAYALDGKMLWCSPLETGAADGVRDVRVVVWDIDGNGKDEVIVRDESDGAAGRERTVVLDPADGRPLSGGTRPDRLPEALRSRSAPRPTPEPLALFWDGDDRRELLDKGKILCSDSREVLGTYRGEPVCIADILGDWREELITRDGSLIRVYTTTIPTATRRPSLMDDLQYRLSTASTSEGCIQPVESPAWREHK